MSTAGSASDFQTFGNLVKVCVGMGVLALPLATYNAGFIATFSLGIIAVLWIVYSLKRLLSCIHSNDYIAMIDDSSSSQDPYADLISRAFPKYGKWLLNFCYVVTLYGAAVAYVITWDKLLSGFDWESMGLSFLSNSIVWAVIFFIIACPLSLIHSLSSLGIVSQIGNVVLALSVIIVIIYGGVTYGFHYDNAMWLPRNPLSIANIFGVLCFSLGVAFIGASSHASMAKKTHFFPVLIISLVTCICFYYIFGSLSVFFYSADSEIHGLILENIPSSSIYYVIASIGLALTCILSYPIAVYPAAIAIESWVTSNETHFFVYDWKRIICRITALFFVCFIGFIYPAFESVVSFIGCFTVSAVSFIFPPFIHYRLTLNLSKTDKIIDILMMVFGCCIMILSTVCSIIS